MKCLAVRVGLIAVFFLVAFLACPGPVEVGICSSPNPCCDQAGNLLEVGTDCDDENPCTQQTVCQSCESGDGCLDGRICRGNLIECLQSEEHCLEEIGTCDPNHLQGNCEDSDCCTFEPSWDGIGMAPACPFAGEEELDSSEWSGSCDTAGDCIGCVENSQCNDSNECTQDRCEAPSCIHENQPGADCTIASAGDGTCVLPQGQSQAVCRKDNGETCQDDNTVCASGWCVDGVCCNNGCSGTCEKCNLQGSMGTCAEIPADQDPCGRCATCESGDCVFDGTQNGDCGTHTTCGWCTGIDQCETALLGVVCDLCKVCDDNGNCSGTPTTDLNCPNIDCPPDPEHLCVDYPDDYGHRCKTHGACYAASDCQDNAVYKLDGASCGDCRQCDGVGNCETVGTACSIGSNLICCQSTEFCCRTGPEPECCRNGLEECCRFSPVGCVPAGECL